MDNQTARELNDINRAFYAAIAEDFDATRGEAWRGWRTLLPALRPLAVGGTLRALDVGCGNGRFGVFLAESLSAPQAGKRPIDYTGIDNSSALLAKADAALSERADLTVRLIEGDIVESGVPDGGDYDLIALLAVLHHVPGAERRAALVRTLAARLAPGGLFVWTSWRFMDFPRFRRRALAWDADMAARVEPGDHLLDWRRGRHADLPALRYCHAIDDAEESALIAAACAAGLRPFMTFRADGEGDRANAYVVLRR
ncbi:MAG: class I SAM-dependent methyltransferase [Chloroflexota bacterium]|nr:class I SAM-dependent methyltransferase [Chloroflexota bacterium]